MVISYQRFKSICVLYLLPTAKFDYFTNQDKLHKLHDTVTSDNYVISSSVNNWYEEYITWARNNKPAQYFDRGKELLYYCLLFVLLFISFIGHIKIATRTKKKYNEQNDWLKGYCAKWDKETHARRNPKYRYMGTGVNLFQTFSL